MKRLWMLLLLTIALLPALPAQDADKPEDDKPKAEEKPSAEIPADFADYIRRVMPGVDPAGEHNLADLKNYTDEAKRHEYTGEMAQLLGIYLNTLQMGPALQQLFDQYSRSKFAESPTFQVLYAVLLSQYPPGMQNIERAREMLTRVTQTHKEFAYSWYYLAQIELGISQHQGQPDVQGAVRTLDKAIALKSDFAAARYLKANLLFATSNNHAEVIAVLEPVVKGKLTMSPDSYTDVMQLYASVASDSAFEATVKDHLSRPDLTDKLRVRAMTTRVIRYLAKSRSDVRPDDALREFEEIQKVVDVRSDPNVALLMHRLGTTCCYAKLDQLSKELPAKKDEYDAFFAELMDHHLQAAEIERLHLPIVLRGPEAERYVSAMVKAADVIDSTAGAAQQRREQALLWLDKYLKDTDLSAANRRRLESLYATIHLRLNPTDEGYIKWLRGLVAATDQPKLLNELAVAREKVRLKQKEYTLLDALNFFIEQINSSDDGISRHAAYLAAHTARNRGGEAIPRAGKAIADRFEKLTEMNSDAQFRLLDDLSESARALGDKPGLERVVRQLVIIAEGNPIKYEFSQLMSGWTSDAFLKTITGAPKAMGALDRRTPAVCAAWLKELAEAIKKAREAEEKG